MISMFLFLLKLNCWKLWIKRNQKVKLLESILVGQVMFSELKKWSLFWVLRERTLSSLHKLKKFSSFCPAYGRKKGQNLKTKGQKLEQYISSLSECNAGRFKSLYLYKTYISHQHLHGDKKKNSILIFLKKVKIEDLPLIETDLCCILFSIERQRHETKWRYS